MNGHINFGHTRERLAKPVSLKLLHPGDSNMVKLWQLRPIDWRVTSVKLEQLDILMWTSELHLLVTEFMPSSKIYFYQKRYYIYISSKKITFIRTFWNDLKKRTHILNYRKTPYLRVGQISKKSIILRYLTSSVTVF